jgi:chemotaxis protein MotA
MDITTIGGLAIGFILILGAFMIEGGNLAGLLQPTAAMIIFGGTIGAVMISFPMDQILKGLKMGKYIFINKELNEDVIIDQLVDFAVRARRDGILNLESLAASNPNPMIRKGLGLVVDGIETEKIRNILSRDIFLVEHEYHSSAEVFEAAGGYSPTMGIVGTVLGLISVLSNLSNPNELGPKIALAFICTFMGILFANLVWLPFANKLKIKAKKEKMLNDMIMEGLIAIQQGENPRIIKEILSTSAEKSAEEKK